MAKKSLSMMVFLFVLAVVPSQVLAMSCHCFSDRDYDPGEPAAADPYYLATSQNSFFSVIFNIDKKKLVLAKQKPGASEEGLWLQYWLASQTALRVSELKKMRAELSSWGELLLTGKIPLDSLPSAFRTLLKDQANDIRLARYVVDSLLVENDLVDACELKVLRQDTATNREVVLVGLLRKKTQLSAISLFQSVERGEKTWGSLLLNAGMHGKKMVKEIRSLLSEV